MVCGSGALLILKAIYRPTRNPGNVSPRLPVVPPAPVTQYYDSVAKPPLGANMNDAHEMDAALPAHITNDIRGQIN